MLGRLLVVLGLFLAWGILILLRLVDLQGFRGDSFKLQADLQQQGFIELAPRRGDILDRNLKELAVSVRGDLVFAQPPQITDPLTASQQLAPLLGEPADSIYGQLKSDSKFIFLKRKVSLDVAQQVRDLGIRGIGTQEAMHRIYPSGSVASHILGIVGIDNEGLEGIEYFYNRELSGKRTRVDLRVDARRNTFLSDAPEVPIQGNSIVLTIDSTIQHLTEKVLRDAVESKGARNGSAIVMNPNTGEILAMASCPDFDPNSYRDYSADARRNRTILDLYEPGSVFKVITLSSLLNEHLVTPDEVIDCRIGAARLAGKVYREAHSSYDQLTVTQIIAKSSNVGTVQLAVRLGEDRFYSYISRLGFGKRTGIDLPGEEEGLLRSTSQWSKLSIGALAIGQEIGVTPLQMIRAASAIANGGYLVKPFVVRRILSPEGETLFEAKAERHRVLDAAATATARSIMGTVVEEGTGKNAALKGYSSGGKTGTAQKIVNGRYSHTKYVGSYLGFAPRENPALIAIVVINEPKGIPYGGVVAAPAFKEIMERALIQARVKQDHPVEVDVENPPLEFVDARSPASSPEPALGHELEETDEESTVSGLPGSVLSVLDAAAVESPDTGEISVETEGTTLPDFTGKSLREVARICARIGIRLRIAGSGSAVSQRPAPGGRVSRDMVCEVFFAGKDKSSDETSGIALRTAAGLDNRNSLRN